MSEDLSAISQGYDDIFKIVTPSYNAALYIEETLISVVSQVTRGTLHYHVQDGGSTDGTLEILESWKDRLKQGRFAASSVALRFSFASEPDAGMYDAVNKGFRFLDVAQSDILTWINADDRLPQGGLATVAQVLRDVPDCRFLSGRVSILTAEGEITGVNAAGVYAQADLASGRHDGRSLPFVMQEGTFFLGIVWLEAGGADTAYRLAGDWDLWRRMARRERHYSLDSVTGFHRRRPGQLSEDMTRYYAEVDCASEEPAPTSVLAREGNLIRHQADLGAWRSVKVDPFAVNPFDLVANDMLEAAVPWQYAEGFGPPEGPYPEYDLPANVRWIRDGRGCVQVVAPVVGRYTVRARLRASLRRPLIRFFVGPRIVYERELVAPRAMVDTIIEFSCWLMKGRSVIAIESADGDAPGLTCDGPSLLVISLEIATDRALLRYEIARHRSASSGSEGCRDVAFVVRSLLHAERLDATLTALVVAGVGRRSIFVENDGDPLTREVADRFDPHVEALVEPGTTSDEVLQGKGFRMRLDLMTGDQLVAGSIEVARCALDDMSLDVIYGLIDGFDSFGRLICRLIDGGSGLRILCGRNTPPRSSVMASTLFLRNNANVVKLDGGAPRVVLHEAGEQGCRLPLLLAAAKGFALLGCDTFLVHAPENSITIACGERSMRGDIEVDGAKVRIALEGVHEIICPAGHDSAALRYVTRRQARDLLSLDDECLAIALITNSEAAVENVLRDVIPKLEQSRRVGIILCGGDIQDPGLKSLVFIDLRQTFCSRSECYVLAAVDVVFQFGSVDERLATAAAMAGTPVVRSDVAAADFVRHSAAPHRQLEETRSQNIAWQSDEAFAMSFREQASRLLPNSNFSQWFTRRESLAVGRVGLRTDHLGLLNAKTSCSLVPILGAQWTTIALKEGIREEVIICTSSEAIFAFEVREFNAQAMHLRVRVEHGGQYEVCVDDRFSMATYIGGEIDHDLIIEASLGMGTHRLKIISNESATPVSLITILDFEILSSAYLGLGALGNLSSLVFEPCCGRETANPREHGDWRRLEGFHETEEPHPQFGLHEVFRWSRQSFKIDLWSEQRGEMAFRIIVRGNHSGQKLRLELDGTDFGWCEPLFGNLASKQKRHWRVSLKQGSNILNFEVSSVTGNIKERIIGVILEGIAL